MKERGVTLAEAIIALGIATVVGTLLLVVIVNSYGLFYKESSKVEQGLGINDTLAAVRESIKQATAIAASYTDGATTYTSGQQQIVLKIPSIDSLGNTISNTFDYFVFFLDPSTGSGQVKLRFKIFPNALSSRKSADQIFSTQVNNLKFQYLDSANAEVIPTSAVKVKITLALRQKAGAAYEQNIATSEANLRND